MTKYELPNGTTIKIPTELLLKMTDEELKDYISNVSGYEISDPFYDSVLNEGEEITVIIDEYELPPTVEDLPEGFQEEDE